MVIKALLLLVILLASAASEAKKPFKILIIDSGVANAPAFSRVSGDKYDAMGHGTHITGLILYGKFDGSFKNELCSRVEIEMCNFVVLKGDGDVKTIDLSDMSKYEACLKKAELGNYDVVNMSLSGRPFSEEEHRSINLITKKGTRVVVAAGNEGKDFSEIPQYPAMHKYKIEKPGMMTVVANGKSYKDRAPSSSFGVEVDLWIDGRNVPSVGYSYKDDHQVLNQEPRLMTGTSQSAALYTRILARRACK